MIVEERTYQLHVGRVPEYLRLYGEEGRAIQEPILGNMVGWFVALNAWGIFKLRVWNLDADDPGEPFADVVAGDAFLEVLRQVVFRRV